MVPISIIMPVYNSEKYISKTIDSILSQSYTEFELLLIDDGSQDMSGKICDEYARKDARVKVVHKKNEGICATRNRGLKIATGKYIAFCDNDDIYMDNLLKDNLELALKYDADVVRFSRRMTTIRDDKIVSVGEMKGFKSRYIKKEDFGKYFDEINLTGEGIWAGIYKKEFLDVHDIKFNELMKYGYEDLYFFTEVYMQEPSIVLNDKVYYNWIMRFQHSTSGKTDINNIDSLMEGLLLKEKLIHKYKIEQLFPHVWLEELSKKIYTIVRYVSPKKVKISLKDRIFIIRHLGECEVFSRAYKSGNMDIFRKKSGLTACVVYKLFVEKCYLLLYCLIIGKQYLVERK